MENSGIIKETVGTSQTERTTVREHGGSFCCKRADIKSTGGKYNENFSN